jgi:hypothetical protein
MEKYGDAKLPELRHMLANCPKAHAHSIHDRCRVRYGEDSRCPEPPLRFSYSEEMPRPRCLARAFGSSGAIPASNLPKAARSGSRRAV